MEENKVEETKLEDEQNQEDEQTASEQTQANVEETLSKDESGILTKFAKFLMGETGATKTEAEKEAKEKVEEAVEEAQEESDKPLSKSDIVAIMKEVMAEEKEAEKFNANVEKQLKKVDKDFHDVIKSKFEKDKNFDLDAYLEEKPKAKANYVEKKEVQGSVGGRGRRPMKQEKEYSPAAERRRRAGL